MEQFNMIQGGSLTIINMFYNASLIVQLIMLGLICASIVSWGIIFDKYFLFNEYRKNAKLLDRYIYFNISIAKLSEKINKTKNSLFLKLFDVADYIDNNTNSNGDKALYYQQCHELKIIHGDLIGSMEDSLNILATIASTSPFVGLFGTVWGIMTSFQSIAANQNTSLAIVAPGIAEALLATAIGLFAAVPASIFYNKFSNDLINLENKLEAFVAKVEYNQYKTYSMAFTATNSNSNVHIAPTKTTSDNSNNASTSNNGSTSLGGLGSTNIMDIIAEQA